MKTDAFHYQRALSDYKLANQVYEEKMEKFLKKEISLDILKPFIDLIQRNEYRLLGYEHKLKQKEISIIEENPTSPENVAIEAGRVAALECLKFFMQGA